MATITIKNLRDAVIAGFRGTSITKSTVSKKLDYADVVAVANDAKIYRANIHAQKPRKWYVDKLAGVERYLRASEARKKRIADCLFFAGRGETWHYEKRGSWDNNKYSRSYHRKFGGVWVSDGCYLVARDVLGSVVVEHRVASEQASKKLLAGLVPEYKKIYQEEINRASLKKKLAQIAVIDVYKVVAKTESGKLISIFDGKTEYRIGQIVSDSVSRGVSNMCRNGGIFVHRSQGLAELQGYPDKSAAADLPRVTIRGYAWGKKNNDGKIAAEYFCPISICK